MNFIAFQSLAIDNVKPVFQKAVDDGLVDKPIFTIWLKSDGEKAHGEVGGAITYGGLDNEHCSTNIFYAPLTSRAYFEFNIDGVEIGS